MCCTVMFNSITYYKKTVQLVIMLYTRSFCCFFLKRFLNYVLALTLKNKPNIQVNQVEYTAIWQVFKFLDLLA